MSAAASQCQQDAPFVVWYFVQLPPNTQIEKKLLEVILHSCGKRWYSSPGFITYLPCDVNASPGGLMSVALVQARVSLQTTGAEASLSPGISRVARTGHCSAGSAHFHHRAHHEWLMKGPFEPMHVWSTFYLESHHGAFTEKWNAGNYYRCGPRTRTDMWLGEGEDMQMQALSSTFVV